jgi:hypothetical protein
MIIIYFIKNDSEDFLSLDQFFRNQFFLLLNFLIFILIYFTYYSVFKCLDYFPSNAMDL